MIEEHQKPKEYNFSQAFEALVVASPEDVVKNIFELNKAIQNATPKDVVAMWHTLELIKRTVNDNIEAQKQVQEMQKSIKSRMKFLVMEDPYGKLESYFKSIVGEL